MNALLECGIQNLDEAAEKYRYYNKLEKFVASRQNENERLKKKV
tara:strand:- start:21045 stop:21176 length:132 start_codon:yes stop_codon:yes gene_type:complete